jgi:hypothetical protein
MAASAQSAGKEPVVDLVSGNWRRTFGFRVGNVYVLDYEDYR